MRGKRLSYNERAIVKSWKLNPENWEKQKEFTHERILLLRNVLTGEEVKIPNYKKGEKL